MFCRLESIDKTEYAIRYNLRKQLLFNYIVLKLRQLKMLQIITLKLQKYYNVLLMHIDIQLVYDEHEKFLINDKKN